VPPQDSHPVQIPDPDEVRLRLAVVLTEAHLLRAQLRVSERSEKERARLRRLRGQAREVVSA
jgi:hypothetical protein